MIPYSTNDISHRADPGWGCSTQTQKLGWAGANPQSASNEAIARLRTNSFFARPEGLEPPTAWFEARNSIQLSYGRLDAKMIDDKL